MAKKAKRRKKSKEGVGARRPVSLGYNMSEEMLRSSYFIVKHAKTLKRAKEVSGIPIRTDNRGNLEWMLEGRTHTDERIIKQEEDEKGIVYDVHHEEGSYSLRVGPKGELTLEDAEKLQVVIEESNLAGVEKLAADSLYHAALGSYVAGNL